MTLAPSMPLDFVIDDLACVRDGREPTMGKIELAHDAVEWLLLLMQQSKLPQAEQFIDVYRGERRILAR